MVSCDDNLSKTLQVCNPNRFEWSSYLKTSWLNFDRLSLPQKLQDETKISLSTFSESNIFAQTKLKKNTLASRPGLYIVYKELLLKNCSRWICKVENPPKLLSLSQVQKKDKSAILSKRQEAWAHNLLTIRWKSERRKKKTSRVCYFEVCLYH